ncbi:MAG: alkene reductase [Phreatobacter sp.]|uniref:alkene reductase n=1 Tax=Phreatobacter sp. TaxID=1966341 RepID=UPI0027367061|nr:alkene reductase [Phreatobacter sp.]MDP2801432.1 alkene reductase [Phreatobacter sp.]
MSQDSGPLFQPFTLGDLTLPNRIVMAPLTRNRATPGTDAANAMTATYYRQRATAGLIISEGTQVSPQGQGYLQTPGLYSDAQVAGWKTVTDAVHAAGGRMFAQIWHVGRVSHESLLNGGAPVAPSAVAAKSKTYIAGGFADVSAPRALALAEIPGVVAEYADAAVNARKAGFDGVEIHGANGYLIDQFLKDGANQRQDAYGGSAENRVRFGLEVVDAILKVFPKTRLGIRLSPVSPANDTVTSDPAEVFGLFVAELSKRGIAFIHVVEGATGGPRDNVPFDWVALRKSFSGAYIANNGYTRDMAIDAVRDGRADLVAFGKAFIANPDLVERLRLDAPLNELDKTTLYGGDAKGYTDYPALAEAAE